MINNYKFGDKKHFCMSTLPKHYQYSNQHHTQALAQHNNRKSATQQIQYKKRLIDNNSNVNPTVIHLSNCEKEGKEKELCVTKCFPFVFKTVKISWNDIFKSKKC